MFKVTTRERVDEFWSTTLGIDRREMHEPGVRVRPHNGERIHWRGLYVLGIGDAAWVFAPAGLVNDLATVTTGLTARTVLQASTWESVLGPRADRILGPSLHHYLDDSSAFETQPAGRRINPGDFTALYGLRAATEPDDWEESGFADHAAMIFGLFKDDEMVAAANLTSGPASATDVGVLTRSDARGRGYGSRVAAAAAKQALAMYGIARYRALATNGASLAVARRLGFAEYGRNIAIYLAG